MTKIFIDLHPDLKNLIHLQRWNYVLDYIQKHPLAPENVLFVNNLESYDISLAYGHKDIQCKYSMSAIPFLLTLGKTKLSKKDHWITWNNASIPGFKSDVQEDFTIEIDVFETIFYHISRWEEWNADPSLLDNHGMLHTNDHYLVKHGVNELPVVDFIIQYFYHMLGFTIRDRATAYNLTHDIDAILRFPTISKFFRANANIIFFQQNKFIKLQKLYKTLGLLLQKKIKDPYNTFDWLFIKKDKKIAHKSIYILSGGRTKYENYFSVFDPLLKIIIKHAQDCGYKIGIHPSYNSGKDKKMIEVEKRDLEKIVGEEIKISRQHFLRYEIRHTGKILDQLGIATDSSIGYRHRIGFRCGTGFPYRMYNFDTETSYKFIEIPLVLMDMSLIHQHGWDPEKVTRHFKEFIAKNHMNTCITFNIHNTTFDPIMWDYKIFQKAYSEVFD